jgi:UDP-N-acetylmuramyl pentapeptide phosphotransferase/UDP-N-acetylglucosamine-1-phosphate transferase
MSLISLVITLIVVGVLLWLINNYIPMDAKIKSILNIVVVVAVVVWLLNLLGLMDSLRGIRVGR